MSNTRNTGFLTNVVKYTDKGDISFVSGSTTLMSISSSGAVTVTGVISGSNALSSSYAVNADQLDNLDSTSFVFTSSFNTYSSSMSTRVSNTESTGSTLTTASASFAVVSSSYSSASGSLSTRVTKIEGNYATTGSNVFLGAQTVCANITSTGTIIAQTLNVQQVTSSVVYSSGSNVFGNLSSDVQQMTGSLRVTGSGNHWFQSGCVGIGTTTPCQKFHVFGQSDGTKGRFELYGVGGINEVLQVSNTANWNPGRGVKVGLYVNSGSNQSQIGAEIGAVTIAADALGADLFFNVASAGVATERFRITSTGIACFACQVCVPNIISTGASGGRYATFGAPTNGGYITFEAGGTAFGDLGSYCAQYGTGDATTLLLGSRTGYALALGTNSAERIRITTAGRVGIGNQAPVSALVVSTASDTTSLGQSGIVIEGSSTLTAGCVMALAFTAIPGTARARAAVGSVVGSDWGKGNLAFYTRDASDSTSLSTTDEKMRITSGGNVGIACTSPGYKLDITALGYGIQHYGNSTNSLRTYAGSGYQIIESTNSSTINQFGYFSGAFFVQTGGADKMTITSGGDVFIGTTNCVSGAGYSNRLSVKANTLNTWGAVEIRGYDSSTGGEIHLAGDTTTYVTLVGERSGTGCGAFYLRTKIGAANELANKLVISNTGTACFACTVCAPTFRGGSSLQLGGYAFQFTAAKNFNENTSDVEFFKIAMGGGQAAIFVNFSSFNYGTAAYKVQTYHGLLTQNWTGWQGCGIEVTGNPSCRANFAASSINSVATYSGCLVFRVSTTNNGTSTQATGTANILVVTDGTVPTFTQL